MRLSIVFKTPKSLLLFSLIIIICNNSFSQTLINSAGNTIQSSTISIAYSIGEISITTLAANPNYITQGLLQPVLQFKDCSLLNLLPNAFTPNNDNINSCFGVKYWPETSSYQLSIYNRFGQLVFKTTNALECWNGDYKGQPQPAGVYVYLIKANTSLCGETTTKGSVMLIR